MGEPKLKSQEELALSVLKLTTEKFALNKMAKNLVEQNKQLQQENIRLNATIKNDELVISKMIEEKASLIEWLKKESKNYSDYDENDCNNIYLIILNKLEGKEWITL